MSELDSHVPDPKPNADASSTPPPPPAASSEPIAPVPASVPPVDVKAAEPVAALSAIPEPLAPPPAPVVIPQPVTPPPAPVKPQAKPIQKPPPSKDALSRFKNKNVEEEEARMGFIDHLMELRKRLWICIVACLVCVLLAVIFYKPLYDVLTGPIEVINTRLEGPEGDEFRKNKALIPGIPAIRLATANPLSNMMLVIWMGFWGGILVASPVMLFQVWAFIAPGLKPSEKKAIMPVLYGGLLFFCGGVYMCYRWMIPPTLFFFVTLDLSLKNTIVWTADTTIDLMLWMMIIAGMLCEIPLIVAAMAKMDVIRGSTLVKHWRGMVFGSILIGAIVSPGNDFASMGVFAGLMLGIYFVSILMAYLFQQKQPKPSAK